MTVARQNLGRNSNAGILKSRLRSLAISRACQKPQRGLMRVWATLQGSRLHLPPLGPEDPPRYSGSKDKFDFASALHRTFLNHLRKITRILTAQSAHTKKRASREDDVSAHAQETHAGWMTQGRGRWAGRPGRGGVTGGLDCGLPLVTQNCQPK